MDPTTRPMTAEDLWQMGANGRYYEQVYRSTTDLTVLTDKDELDGEDVVPGFRLPVVDVFG